MSDDRPTETLKTQAKGMIYDLDPDAPLTDDGIWVSALSNALGDLSRYRPLRKRITLEIKQGEDSISLPADFITLDEPAFNRALKSFGQQAYVRDLVFALESITAASSDLRSAYSFVGTSPFASGSVIEVIDDGAGARELFIQTPPQASATINTIYLARHQVADAVDAPPTPAVNTVPEDLRDLLVLRMCYHACISLASLVAGDSKTSEQFRECAKDFNEQYEERTRFAPIGALA